MYSPSPQEFSVLQRIYNAGQNPVYVTAAEGTNLASAGLIQVNAAEKDPQNSNAFRVILTELGNQVVTNSVPAPVPMAQPMPSAPPSPAFAPTPAPAMPASNLQPVSSLPATLPDTDGDGKPDFQIDSGIAIPKSKRGNAGNLTPRESIYPFDSLQVGQSFHVARTQADPEPWKKMGSNVSAANRRFQVEAKDANGNVILETKNKKTLIKDSEGNPVLNAEGKRQYHEEQVEEPKMIPTRKFVARRVYGEDPRGEGVRVFRTE